MRFYRKKKDLTNKVRKSETDIPSKKRKIIPKEMASEIWDLFENIMRGHHKKGFRFDEEKMKEIKEYTLLYSFLIHNEIPKLYPQKGNEIILEINNIIKRGHFDYLIDGLEPYQKAWNGTVTREENKDDRLILNNPIYCISRLASVRCFGESDMKKIVMFSSKVNSFIETLIELQSSIEVVDYIIEESKFFPTEYPFKNKEKRMLSRNFFILLLISNFFLIELGKAIGMVNISYFVESAIVQYIFLFILCFFFVQTTIIGITHIVVEVFFSLAKNEEDKRVIHYLYPSGEVPCGP